MNIYIYFAKSFLWKNDNHIWIKLVLVPLLIELQLLRCSRRHSYGKQLTLAVIKPNARAGLYPPRSNSPTIRVLVSCDMSNSNLSSSFSVVFAGETSSTVSPMFREIALTAVRNYRVSCKSIGS